MDEASSAAALDSCSWAIESSSTAAVATLSNLAVSSSSSSQDVSFSPKPQEQKETPHTALANRAIQDVGFTEKWAEMSNEWIRRAYLYTHSTALRVERQLSVLGKVISTALSAQARLLIITALSSSPSPFKRAMLALFPPSIPWGLARFLPSDPLMATETLLDSKMLTDLKDANTDLGRLQYRLAFNLARLCFHLPLSLCSVSPPSLSAAEDVFLRRFTELLCGAEDAEKGERTPSVGYWLGEHLLVYPDNLTRVTFSIGGSGSSTSMLPLPTLRPYVDAYGTPYIWKPVPFSIPIWRSPRFVCDYLAPSLGEALSYVLGVEIPPQRVCHALIKSFGSSLVLSLDGLGKMPPLHRGESPSSVTVGHDLKTMVYTPLMRSCGHLNSEEEPGCKLCDYDMNHEFLSAVWKHGTGNELLDVERFKHLYSQCLDTKLGGLAAMRTGRSLVYYLRAGLTFAKLRLQLWSTAKPQLIMLAQRLIKHSIPTSMTLLHPRLEHEIKSFSVASKSTTNKNEVVSSARECIRQLSDVSAPIMPLIRKFAPGGDGDLSLNATIEATLVDSAERIWPLFLDVVQSIYWAALSRAVDDTPCATVDHDTQTERSQACCVILQRGVAVMNTVYPDLSSIGLCSNGFMSLTDSLAGGESDPLHHHWRVQLVTGWHYIHNPVFGSRLPRGWASLVCAKEGPATGYLSDADLIQRSKTLSQRQLSARTAWCDLVYCLSFDATDEDQEKNTQDSTTKKMIHDMDHKDSATHSVCDPALQAALVITCATRWLTVVAFDSKSNMSRVLLLASRLSAAIGMDQLRNVLLSERDPCRNAVSIPSGDGQPPKDLTEEQLIQIAVTHRCPPPTAQAPAPAPTSPSASSSSSPERLSQQTIRKSKRVRRPRKNLVDSPYSPSSSSSSPESSPVKRGRFS